MLTLFNKYKGLPCYIVGKGVSFLDIKADIFKDHQVPVIALYQTIVKLEKMNLPNPIFSMQKDGGSIFSNIDCSNCHNCKANMVYPEKSPLLLSALSKNCLSGYENRCVLDCDILHTNQGYSSMMVSVRLAQYMGCSKVIFVSFDSYTRNDHRNIYLDGEKYEINEDNPDREYVNYNRITINEMDKDHLPYEFI